MEKRNKDKKFKEEFRNAVALIDKVKQSEGAFGFNAEAMRFEDLLETGIIDPTKVVRSALENAASAASMFLTTEAVIADLPKKEEGMPPMPGGMPGGMPRAY